MIILLIATIAAALSIIYYAFLLGITPNRTNQAVQKSLLQQLPDGQYERIVDLGSGWGCLAICLAKAYPHSRVVGYELSFVPWLVSWVRQKILRLNNLQFVRKNFYTISLEEADLICCYLYPKGMAKVQGKLTRELKPGAVVISHTFAFPTWKPVKSTVVQDLYRTKIYVYGAHLQPSLRN